MKDFTEYFSMEAIVNEVIRIRLGTARKRHDRHFLCSVSSAAGDPVECVPGCADSLLPSRRQWRRPKRDSRKGFSKDEVNTLTLRRTVFGYIRRGRLADTEWGRQLDCFILEVLRQIADDDFVFSTPKMIAMEKPGKPGLHRPIASYDKLSDRVILALLARYLRDCFDEDLSDSLYSFRRAGIRNHHTAIQHLKQYRSDYGRNGLFVAECDIRSFYDCVSHDEVRSALRHAVVLAESRGRETDPRALLLADAYLKSYSFLTVALPGAEAELARTGRKGRIDGPSLRQFNDLGHRGSQLAIGIPQGGAVSPLMANLVLSRVDRAVLDVPIGDRPFYARFCDDFLIAHPDRDVCEDALKRCLGDLASMRIPTHKPVKVSRYSKEYYGVKSKLPYLWAEPRSRKQVVPWVSFLGYQVRYDGDVRIRRGSIENEQQKQKRMVGEIARLLYEDPTKCNLSRGEIMSRTRARMIAMAVGRKDLRILENTHRQPCWADSFFLVNDNRHSRNQLVALDRGRERQLKRLQRVLKRLDLPIYDRPAKPSGDTKFYWGAPYSYYGHFSGSQDGPVRFIPTSSSTRDYSL